jgi:hypothetical protein
MTATRPGTSPLLVGPTPVFLVAALTASVVLYIWGSLNQVGYWHDEASYLLQAGIFARGRWTAPAPPMPEFFQQLYVLVSPVFASKYPPGHALLLAPGVLVGMPGLVPVLLSAVTGALVFAVGRRLGGPMLGIFGWLIWLGTDDNLHFRSSYLSEVTTSALWVLGWWALLRWREEKRQRWLVLVAAAVAWQAITRPLTAVAYAVPVLVAVTVARRREWRELALPIGVGCAILAIIPLWSRQTTGNWRLTPFPLYTDAYTPWDRPGFGADTSKPAPQRAPDLMEIDRAFRSEHQAHALAGLPRALFDRADAIREDMWGKWRVVLVPFALLGLLGLGAVELTALAAAVLLVVAYLAYAHPPYWTLYYLELEPALALLTARGVVRGGRWVTARWRHAALGLAAVALAAMIPIRAAWVHRTLHAVLRRQIAFRQMLEALPDPRTIVFVRYAPNHNPHDSLIRNAPFLADAPGWIVYDRGTDDARLTRLAPDRAPYLFDEASGTIQRLPLDGSAGASPRR